MNVYIKEEEGQCWKYKITWENTHAGSKFGLALKSKIRYFWNFAVNGGRDSSYNKCFFSLLWSFISQFVSVCKMRLPDAQQKMASALTFRSFQAEQDKESLPVQCTDGYYYPSFNTIAVSGQPEYCTIFHFCSLVIVCSSIVWNYLNSLFKCLWPRKGFGKISPHEIGGNRKQLEFKSGPNILDKIFHAFLG